MKRGHDVELPLWLAKVLSSTQMILIEKNSMKGFDQAFHDNLDADANKVSFARHPYFYTVGIHLSKL